MSKSGDPSETGQKNGRRDFLKGAATVAAAGAAVAISQQASAASLKDTRKGTVSQVALTFDASKQPTREDVFQVLDKIFGQVGCYNCGLAGLDLRLGVEEIMRFDTQVPVFGVNRVSNGF